MTPSASEPNVTLEAARRLFDELCDVSYVEQEARLDGAAPELAALVRELLLADAEPEQGIDAPIFERRSVDARLPETIGRFHVVDRIGAGGMGVVYRARQESPDRLVALKVVRSAAASASSLRRFEHEAQILGWLDHPGIARIYEAGTVDTGHGTEPYFAMELVEGRPLTRYANEEGLGLRERLALFAKVCDAVRHAHQKGVIHRDLKPGNVLVDADGQPKVLDFGVARAIDGGDTGRGEASTMHTLTGELLGTLPYMSPEQLAGDARSIDTRSDVYALGVIAYELLSGELPHRLVGRAVHEAARIVSEDEPTSLGAIDRTLRGDVETIVGKAISKDVEHRYTSADELASDVRRFLDDEPIVARRPTTWYQLRKFARRHRAFVVGVVAVVISLVAGTITSTALYLEKERERQGAVEAQLEADEARAEEARERQQAVEAREEADRARDDAIAARRDEEAARESADAARVRAEDALAAREEVMRRFTEILLSPTPWTDGMDVRLVDVLDRAAERSRDAFQDHPEVRAQLLSAIGQTYGGLGLHDRALPLIEEYARLADVDGVDPMVRLEARVRTGYFRAKHGDPSGVDDALGALAKLKELDPPLELLVRSSAFVAEILQPSGRLAEAADLAREAIDVSADSTDRALRSPRFLAMKTLGDALFRLGRPREAHDVLVEALELSEGIDGNEAHAVLTLNSLAASLSAIGDYPRAEEMMLEVLARMRALGAERHEFYAIQLSNMAQVVGLAGDAERSLDYFAQSLELVRELYPSPSPHEGIALGNLASQYRRMGLVDAGEEAGREATAILAQTHGPDSVVYANALATHAGLLIDQARFEEGAERLATALDVRGRRAPEHRDQQTGYVELAGALVALGEWERAAGAARTATELLAQRRGPVTATVSAFAYEAIALAQRGDFDPAFAAAEAAEQQASASGEQDRAIANAAFGLMIVMAGGADEGWGRYDAAAAVLDPGSAWTPVLASAAERVRAANGGR